MSDTWPGQPEQAAPAWPGQAEQSDAPAPPISGPDGWSEAGKPFVNSTGVGTIMRAFGQGFGEAWGPERLGLSKDSTEWLAKTGIFASGSKYENPFQAFNEGVIVNTATALDGIVRGLSGTYHGLQAAGIEAGLHRDIVSIPDEWMGRPHALGTIKMRSGLPKDLPVGGSLDVPTPETIVLPPSIEAYHGSPYSFDAFSSSRVGTGEGAQTYGHGLYFAEKDKVASSYQEKLTGPKRLDPEDIAGQTPAAETARMYLNAAYGDGDPVKAVTKLNWMAEQVKNELEKTEFLDAAKLIADKAGEQEPAPGALYKVDIKVDKNLMLDWDRPLGEQSPAIQAALDKLVGAELGSGSNGEGAYRYLIDKFGSKEQASRALSEAGIPGIKYLDKGSRDSGTGTRNFVVFDERDVHITHKNGAPIPTPDDTVAQARDLGVIGPERPPISEGAPKDVAEAVVSRNADGPKGETVSQELPGQKDPWQERFEGFVSKLEAPDDVKQLIRDSAKENGNFLPARQGDIPLSHVEGIADAAGVDASEINPRGLGRKLQNDAEVRTAMRMMLQVTDDVKNAAREVKADGSPESLIKFQESIMRRDLAVEQVVGLRAEWGRTGNVIQEFMRDVKDQEGLNIFLKDKGRSPADLRDIAHTIDALDRGQAARLLNDLRTPTAWDKFRYYWVNALISGPVTHTKYAIANTAFGLYESALVTPIAGAIGTARRALLKGAEAERVQSAAVKVNDKIYTGANHLEALEKAAAELGTDVDKIHTKVDDAKQSQFDAWVTSKGRLIDSKEAADIAKSPHEKLDSGDPEFSQQKIGRNTEGVFIGEAAARTWGIVAGVPDALVAAVKAAKTGMQTALPGELAQNIIPKNNKNLPFQQRPIPGSVGAVIGLPSRGASAIHSFFNFLGYRASIEAQAYRAAAKEGLSVTDDAFWQRRAATADKPTPEMMNSAIEEGYRLTFINEMGETGRKMSAFVNATKLGQLVMPFVHIPLNILKRSLEGTPAAFLDAETREALAGKQGAVKQDMAAARLIAGGAVGAWVVNGTLNDTVTGFGPTDQKERAQWLATGHQPYSVRIGDEWYSYNRFGPIGTMMGLYSNLAEVIPHMKPDSEELTKAITMAVHSTGRLMEDEVGMQGLAGLMDAINEPDRKGTRFVSSFAGSMLPYSSALRQTASAMDPYMRETKSIVDGLRYYIPNARQGLNAKRDWLGSPIANAGYGGDIPAAPGASAIIQHRDAVSDPVSLEAAALDIHPAPPQDRIHGVKLTPKLYDTYQATAGPLLRQSLESYISQPGWHDMPTFVRQEMFHSAIKTSRSMAAAAMQMQHPELIQQAVKDRVDRINGAKPTKKLTD